MKTEKILKEIDFISYPSDNNIDVEKVVSLNEVNGIDNGLTWCSDKNANSLLNIKTESIVIVSQNVDHSINDSLNYLVVENPRRTFMEVLKKFFLPVKQVLISKYAYIDETVVIGKNVNIGNNVVIESNCKIGDNTSIDHNSIIKENTVVGDNVIIGCNNTIGGAGYGYEKNETGEFEFIPHIGNVIIKDDVEIGNNTCIDRAVLGSTILEDNVKVDNLVHIAHGVKVGKNSMIIANSMVAGSVTIGENAWIAPSASILNQKTIGDNVLIGMGAVVLKDVPENKIYIGNPARDLKKKS